MMALLPLHFPRGRIRTRLAKRRICTTGQDEFDPDKLVEFDASLKHRQAAGGV
jgi:hypothetical protein